MEAYRPEIGGLRRLLSDCGSADAVFWSSDSRYMADVVRPVPRRAPASASLALDWLLGPKSTGSSRSPSRTAEEIGLGVTLRCHHGQDDNQQANVDFFCASPPSRADNPLSRDPVFLEQSSSFDPLVTSQFRSNSSPSCSPSVSSRPMQRVEGFALA